MGDLFKGKGTTDIAVLLDLPMPKRYCKTVSGNVTKRGTVKHGQISCHPVFAGKRKVEYKPSFFEALEKRENVVFDANTLIERAMKEGPGDHHWSEGEPCG